LIRKPGPQTSANCSQQFLLASFISGQTAGRTKILRKHSNTDEVGTLRAVPTMQTIRNQRLWVLATLVDSSLCLYELATCGLPQLSLHGTVALPNALHSAACAVRLAPCGFET